MSIAQVPYLVLNNVSGQMVPISALDNFLIQKDFKDYECEFYNILDGTKLNTRSNIWNFFKKITGLAKEKKYLTTDHLIYSICIDSVKFLYVSLDNSVRANSNSHSLANNRLENLMNVVSNIIKQDIQTKWVVFFSESCRPSFDGDMQNKSNEVSWLQMRELIHNITGLDFLTEKRNNEDYQAMSFGISVWTNMQNLSDIPDQVQIQTYYSAELLDRGFGSVAVGIRLKTNKIVWGVHFPLDFKNISQNISENYGVITMKNLLKLMNSYPNSVCAFGDMNLIPGDISREIRNVVLTYNDNALQQYKLLLDDDTYTFFGAYYDTIPISTYSDNTKYELVQLLDLNNMAKFKLMEYARVGGGFLSVVKFCVDEYIKYNFAREVYLPTEPKSAKNIVTNRNLKLVYDEIKKYYDEYGLDINNISFEVKREKQEVNLYPEMFEYFNSDGNLVSGYFDMLDEYARLEKNPIWINNMHLVLNGKKMFLASEDA